MEMSYSRAGAWARNCFCLAVYLYLSSRQKALTRLCAVLLISIAASSSLCAASTDSVSKPGAIWIASGASVSQLDLVARRIGWSFLVPRPVQALVIDTQRDALWVLSYPTLSKFGTDGNRVFDVDLISLNVQSDAKTLRINPYDGSVWIAADHSLVHINHQGNIIARWSTLDSIRAIELGLDDSAWVLTNKAFVRVSPSAEVLSSLDLTDLLNEPRYLALDNVGNRATLASASTIFSSISPASRNHRAG
jgi:hypothetical protein